VSPWSGGGGIQTRLRTRRTRDRRPAAPPPPATVPRRALTRSWVRVSTKGEGKFGF